MGLDKDNPSHRAFDKKLDAQFNNSAIYNRFARPIIHGTYHAGRFVGNGLNPEEWARAKDQISKFGTGQQQTEYLEAHRAQKKKEQEETLKKALEMQEANQNIA